MENPSVKIDQPIDPIDSWGKREFIKYGKELLKNIRRLAPDIWGGNHGDSIFANNWIAHYIRILYKFVENGKFTLKELGTNEEKLKEAIAPSRKYRGELRAATPEERDRTWRRVFEKPS